jgi:hypothetical protein
VHALSIPVLVAIAFVAIAAIAVLLRYAFVARPKPRPRVILRPDTPGLRRQLPARHDHGRFRGRWD